MPSSKTRGHYRLLRYFLTHLSPTAGFNGGVFLLDEQVMMPCDAFRDDEADEVELSWVGHQSRYH